MQSTCQGKVAAALAGNPRWKRIPIARNVSTDVTSRDCYFLANEGFVSPFLDYGMIFQFDATIDLHKDVYYAELQR